MLISGEVVVSEAWDQTAFKLYAQNPNIASCRRRPAR